MISLVRSFVAPNFIPSEDFSHKTQIKNILSNQQNFAKAVPNDTKVQNINYFEIFMELDQRT